MTRLLPIAALSGALMLAACGTVNATSERLGLGVEFQNVYEEASTIEDRVYLSAGMYNSTLEVLITQCEDTGELETLAKACEEAATKAERLSPAVTALLDSVGVYVTAKERVAEAVRNGGTASPELIAAVASSLTALTLEFEQIRGDLKSFINGPA